MQYAGDATGINIILSGYYSSVDIYAYQRFNAEQLDPARRIMKMLDITALENRLYSAMSTGEQRRRLLGRALVHDPGTLILDEPTSGLDLKACFQYLEIVRSLMKAGKTIVLVTHHIHEIPPEVSRAVC